METVTQMFGTNQMWIYFGGGGNPAEPHEDEIKKLHKHLDELQTRQRTIL